MGVRRGTWTARNAVVVIALAVALGVLVWIRFLVPDASGTSATARTSVAPASYPIGGHMASVRSNQPGLRVLFVGNSLTYTHDIPTMVEKLAEGDRGARLIFAGEYAPSNWTLELAARDKQLTRGIGGERWDDVVLQEHGYVGSLPGYRGAHMFPAAQTLAGLARHRGARTVLFMTWGSKDGDPRGYRHDSYSAMQARIASGYNDLSSRLRAPIAPVGLAWQRALLEHPDAPLWGPDGHHPSQAGSYLAACVLYARLTHRDPRRSRFTAGLGRTEARGLQRIAASTAAMQ